MRIVIAAGGTGGHVIPGLALGRTLADRGHRIEFVGTAERLEARLVPQAGFEFHAVQSRPFARELSWAAARAPLAALRAVGECRPIVRGADAALGMGGYASVPVALAARREGVPLLLHEQNAVPGLANRFLARLAQGVALSFEVSRRRFPRRIRAEVTGNPVREEILRVLEEREALAKEGYARLELDAGRKTVVIFGGSQGALHIDRVAVGACRLLASREDLQLVVITGPAHLDDMRRAVPAADEGLLVRLLGYLDRMELAYACADLVVCRAGATTAAELTVCGLPSLLIPYPYATGGHQEANARTLQRAGAASVMLDDQLSSESLAHRIESLVDHEERLRAMAARSTAVGRPDASQRLADLIESVVGGGGE